MRKETVEQRIASVKAILYKKSRGEKLTNWETVKKCIFKRDNPEEYAKIAGLQEVNPMNLAEAKEYIANFCKNFCKDDCTKIEGYDRMLADLLENGYQNKRWCIHHRLEITLDGNDACSKKDLERLGMYFGRPYFELIIMTYSEHCTLHASTPERKAIHSQKMSVALKGKAKTEEWKRFMSNMQKGKPSGNKGKRRQMSEEHKKAWISALHEGKRRWINEHPEEHAAHMKKMREKAWEAKVIKAGGSIDYLF